MCNKGDNDSYY